MALGLYLAAPPHFSFSKLFPLSPSLRNFSIPNRSIQETSPTLRLGFRPSFSSAVASLSSSINKEAELFPQSTPLGNVTRLDFPILDQKGQYFGSRRASKVQAFNGLKTPPYKLDALEPYMSQMTLEMHWGKHHQGYVDCLNKQLENNPLYGCTMEELVKVTYNNGNPLAEFNNAAQVWNHDFFWESMQPGGGKIPRGGVLEQIEKDFGSFVNFKEVFVDTALSQFGSGWVWLVLKPQEKRLAVIKTSNAVNPLVLGDIPIISLDMWEHAYYLDYKDNKARYVNVFMNSLVSWPAATARMARAEAFVNLGEPKIPVA